MTGSEGHRARMDSDTPRGYGVRGDVRKRAEARPTLCRTCMRPITHETRTEPGYKPREGWYDDCRSDPIVCFKAVAYRHVPLTDRERAYWEAGYLAAGGAL